jgi:DNA-binding MarR family transcriptional regulator
MTTPATASSPSPGGGFGYLLIHAAQTWRTEAGRVLHPFGLTVPQFLLIMAVYRQARHDWPSLTQSEIATRLGMDANTTSQVVRGLERRGLVTRTSSNHDARARAVSLTASGLVRSIGSSAAVRAMNDRYFGEIQPNQLEMLGSILETLGNSSSERQRKSKEAQ